MNITCPKCGFDQPKDKFCANCGVDIENFHSPGQSLGQRILTSSFFYLFLAFVLIIGAFYIVRQLASRQNFAPEPPQFNLDQKPIQAQTEAPSSPEPAPPAEQPAAFMAGETAAPAPTAPGANEVPATAVKRRTMLKVLWLEVNKDYFVDMFGENLPVGQVRAGILLEEFNGRTLKSRLEQGSKDKMIRTLDTSTHPLSAGDKYRVALRTTDPRVNEKVGVLLDLSRITLDETGLQFHIEIQRSQPILQGRAYAVDSQNLSDDMLVPARGAAFISGFFTHREPYDETEQKLFSANSALKVFNSKTFQAGNSEIVILIETD
jgi:hypothetical protein